MDARHEDQPNLITPLREGTAPALPDQSCAGFDSRGERNCFGDSARIPLEALRQFPEAVVYMQASNLLQKPIRDQRNQYGLVEVGRRRLLSLSRHRGRSSALLSAHGSA